MVRYLPPALHTESDMWQSVLVLDELDHAASDSRALDSILSLPAINSESFCLIGIANTHTLTSSVNTGTSKDVLTIHFAPYTAAQLQQILQSRLCVLNDNNPTDAGTKALFPLPALTLLTKKIAAMTGDVRNLFETLRRAIDIATSAPNLNENPLNHTPTVTPASILQALKSHTPTSNGTSSTTSSEPAACNSEIVRKINGINLQARVILLCVLLTSKRLAAGLPLSSGSLAPRKAPSLKRSHSASHPRQSCIDTAQLHSYYSATLFRCDAACLNVASKSEFGDLLVILEGAGLISSGSHLSSTTSVKQGKKAVGRSASFSGLRKSLATSHVQLADGVWTNEVLRGLGIADVTGDDVLQCELRGIWERETARLEREIKSLRPSEHSNLD
jgi:cell division control protein 6